MSPLAVHEPPFAAGLQAVCPAVHRLVPVALRQLAFVLSAAQLAAAVLAAVQLSAGPLLRPEVAGFRRGPQATGAHPADAAAQHRCVSGLSLN